jgi:hypothetical protein
MDGRHEEHYMSTLVRIKRGDVWYAIHCVESAIFTTPDYWQRLVMKMNTNVYGVQTLYIVNTHLPDGPQPDKIQIEETERLKQMFRL